MREIDSNGLALCRFQADVFVASLQGCACSSPIFIRRFMNSDVARTMDLTGMAGAPSSPELALDLVEEQYGPSSYGTQRYPEDVLHWIGYLYRYWALVVPMPSKRVYAIANGREMRSLYAAYHTLDPEAAVRRILEAHDIDVDEDPIALGVRVLRRIRAERAKG